MERFLVLLFLLTTIQLRGDDLKGNFGDEELKFDFLGAGVVDVTYQYRRSAYGPIETATVRGNVQVANRDALLKLKAEKNVEKTIEKMFNDFPETKGYGRLFMITFPSDSNKSYFLIEHRESLVDVFTSKVYKKRGWFG